MSGPWAAGLLVLAFVLVGGAFAAAELALVSLRESQIRALSGQGRRGKVAAALAEDPNRFLAAVQVGVTFAGFFSAAYGTAAFQQRLEPRLVAWGVSPTLAAALAIVVITGIVSYLSLVLGELVPKRLALQSPERTARRLAPLVDGLARVARPLVWLLSQSTDLVVRLVGGDPSATRDEVTDAEIRELVAGHSGLGEDERRIVEDVFEAGERHIREVMLPRTEVDFLDAAIPLSEAVRLVRGMPHSRYPVVRGNPDDVVGFVHVRDLLAPADTVPERARVGEIARQILMLPGTRALLPALSDMRRNNSHLAIVLDEYGGTDGIVTLEDIVEELIGDIQDEYDLPGRAEGPVNPGGPYEVDGLLNLEDFTDATSVTLPEGPYETAAGYVIARLGRLPQEGDEVEADRHVLRVLELDGRRVARLLVTPRLVDEPRSEGLAGQPGTAPEPQD